MGALAPALLLLISMIAACFPPLFNPTTLTPPAPYPVSINSARVEPIHSVNPIQIRYGDQCDSFEFDVKEIRDDDAPKNLFYRFDFFLEPDFSEALSAGTLNPIADGGPVFGFDPPEGACVSLGEDSINAPSHCDQPSQGFDRDFRTYGRGPFTIEFRVSDERFPQGIEFDSRLQLDGATYDVWYWDVELNVDADCVGE